MNRTLEVEMKSESFFKTQKKLDIRLKIPRDCLKFQNSGFPPEGI